MKRQAQVGHQGRLPMEGSSKAGARSAQSRYGNAALQEQLRGRMGMGGALQEGPALRLSGLSEVAALLGMEGAGLTATLDTSGYLEQQGALAAAAGTDLLFREEEPAAETIAHEVVHAAQGGTGGGEAVAGASCAAEQEADAAVPALLAGEAVAPGAAAGPGVHLQREGGESPAGHGETEAPAEDAADPWACEGEKMTDIEAEYRDIVATGRALGLNTAADLLEHYLDGAGGEVLLPSTWLRSFDAVVRAEERIQGYFETWFLKVANAMAEGASLSPSTYWEATLVANPATELYYASGISSIRSEGTFAMQRSSDVVSITGEVDHGWWDVYDWHPGTAVFLPGFGKVEDVNAGYLTSCGARNFTMDSHWTQTVSGAVEVGDGWFKETELTWEGPA